MKKIIVTGGAGYIGSHTAVALIEAGYQVVVIDNLCNSSDNVLRGIESITSTKVEFHNVDLRNNSETEEIFKQHQDSFGVIHFAAYKCVPESVEKPKEYYKNNIESLLNVTTAMDRYGISNLVFSSSCTVYGDTEQLPVSEQTPWLPPNSPYGHTKQLGEMILKNMSSLTNSKLKTVSLRYFNPIGAHPSALIGELPIGAPNNLMPYITQTAIGLREELSVFGDDYPTSDGSAVRDYIHVCDLADAHVLALVYMAQHKDNYSVFNIGTGKGNSVLEVIQSFEKISGSALNYKIVPRRAGDIAEIYADPTKANMILGWQPKYSLDDMTKSAWKWEQSLVQSK